MSNFLPLYYVVVRRLDDEHSLCVACDQKGEFVIYEGSIIEGRYTMTPLPTNKGFLTFDAAKTFAESYTPPDMVCEHGTAMDVHCCNCHSGFIFEQDHVCPSPDTDEDAASKTIEPPKSSSRPRKRSSGSKTSTSI